jgi:2-amino-4-hydroxy-6-hydroxymethyldihydropteridine diphosphokinase
MPVCLIGLGSNQGDRRAALDAAVAQLGRQPQIMVRAVSVWRETAPVGGPPDQLPFLNGALTIETSLGPHELLSCLQQIENSLGRRRTERWGSRTVDIDLLLYDDLVLNEESLVLPHPRMAWRRFVLEPAAEVAGAMLHPTIGWTITRLLQHLNSARPYVAITGPIAAGKTHLAERLAAALSARLILEQPDWARLDDFYADPANRGWQMELDFLDQRARMLAADATVWPDQHWTISDFWFDQSAAFAKAWLPENKLSAYLEQYERARQGVVRPKLVVLLDSPARELLVRVGCRGRACERRLTVEQMDRIRQAVLEQASRADVGPVLRASGDDPEAIFAEVLAAVRGME